MTKDCSLNLYLQKALFKVQGNFLCPIEDDDQSFYPDEGIVKLDLIHNMESIIDATNADE